MNGEGVINKVKGWGNTGRAHWSGWNKTYSNAPNIIAGSTGIGAVGGGIAGGMSDDHTALGGIAAGAGLGALGSIGYAKGRYYNGWSAVKEVGMTPVGAPRRFTTFSNPENYNYSSYTRG